jgi:hypothetical protein
MIFFILTFDESGRLNKELHMRQKMARYSLHLNVPGPAEDVSLLDAKDRFLTCGGQWKPSAVLEDRLCGAALGKLKCRRV